VVTVHLTRTTESLPEARHETGRTALALPPCKSKGDLLKACSGHLLARVDLMGRYEQKES
jgi:hypothetical protein